MPSTPIAYNPSLAAISGTQQVGELAVGTSAQAYSTKPGGVTWWMSPDTASGYVISAPRAGQPNQTADTGTVRFWRSKLKTDASFLELVNKLSKKFGGGVLADVTAASAWLTSNGYWTSYSAPTTTTTTAAPTIITSGLILNYDISNSSSYSGSGATITDLQGNSSATTANSPTYTSSGGGYLTFNGSNQYFVTNTSLNSKLSPANTSNVLSIFVWVYPMDNGVIVAELGQATTNALWHDSQIEMVSGTIKFSVWSGSVQNLSSSISTPLNNWYYVGFTYDGTNLRGYVNGSLAVTSGTISRQTPYNNGSGVGLHYSVASIDSTSLGDGTYANMRFGGMQIYNTALTGSNVLTNFNATKSRFGL